MLEGLTNFRKVKPEPTGERATNKRPQWEEF
jgi:hypothetical protein